MTHALGHAVLIYAIQFSNG